MCAKDNNETWSLEDDSAMDDPVHAEHMKKVIKSFRAMHTTPEPNFDLTPTPEDLRIVRSTPDE